MKKGEPLQGKEEKVKKVKKTITSSNNASSRIIEFKYILLSFLIGVLAIAIPFLFWSDCRTFESLSLTWPLSFLANYKCSGSNYGISKDSVNKNDEQGSDEKEPLPIPMDFSGQLRVYASGHCIKKAESTAANECGEDAFSVNLSTLSPKSGRSFMAVADGVGGWGASGGDSSKVSVGLLEELKNIVKSTRLSLSEAGQLAFSRMASSKTYKQGSTTVCAGLLDHETGMLYISNVGDSGAYIFRNGKMILKTKLGIEGFNAPHQIGFDQEGTPYGSFTLMETKHSLKVFPGDVIVLATDGILDNLYDEELKEMTLAMLGTLPAGTLNNKHPSKSIEEASNERVKSVATSIAWHAWARSQESHWISPFAQSAHKYGYAFSGGKQDDITVVVSVIR